VAKGPAAIRTDPYNIALITQVQRYRLIVAGMLHGDRSYLNRSVDRLDIDQAFLDDARDCVGTGENPLPFFPAWRGTADIAQLFNNGFYLNTLAKT